MIELTDDAMRRSRETEPRGVGNATRSSAIAWLHLRVPPRLPQGLEKATDDQLAAIEILGRGCGLHWEAVDVAHSILDLLVGVFGTNAYMARRCQQTGSRRRLLRHRQMAGRADGARKSAR
ncbi:DUF2442 domain-containing protein [Rhizobium sullae]|uniref:DUF2442 domain-containing protein n=1 Tax=Rhizobium sullae TaxID=50338 RepID=UPI000B353ADE|nr:DUF2442 domain-containing protein [Rhizobium sullae]